MFCVRSLFYFFISILLYHNALAKPLPFKGLSSGDFLVTHQKVGISKVSLAARSLTFPDFIPLVFGNSIYTFIPIETGYEISHSRSQITEVDPLRRRHRFVNAAGFVMKRSTLGVYPVPMENSVVIARLIKVSGNYGIVHLWLASRGIYSRSQKKKQLLHARSLLSDFADNVQRSLGVRDCSPYPKVSGLCNNRLNTLSGVTVQRFRQDTPDTRVPTPQLIKMQPTARQISDAMFKKESKEIAPMRTNALMVFFGQFIDHEIVATPSEHIDSALAAAIPMPDGSTSMEFTRSAVLRFSYSKCCHAPYSEGRVWESSPFNVLTSFIDGGAIYGSDNLRANALRSFQGGELILQKRGGEDDLPVNGQDDVPFVLENEGEEKHGALFVAGDVRANENPILLSLHTIFAREHNRVCRMLRRWVGRKRRRRAVGDEWLYREAKQIVVAELQSITFHEFVPAMLGENALGKYEGYDADVDARISTMHASFGFRWGHSGVPEVMSIRDRRGRTVELKLRDMFFDKGLYTAHGLDNLILGAMNTAAGKIDTSVAESLRNFLFNKEAGRLDLVALNIQRARDFGVGSYLSAQAAFKTGKGLENIGEELQKTLLDVYGKAEKIDAFVGGLAETTKEGSVLGPLFHAINVDQFRRLRDGDRFYYENVAWKKAVAGMPLVKRIRRHEIRLLDIIYANTRVSRNDIGARDSAFKTKMTH